MSVTSGDGLVGLLSFLLVVREFSEEGGGKGVQRHSQLSCSQVHVVWAESCSQVHIVWDNAESGDSSPRYFW